MLSKNILIKHAVGALFDLRDIFWISTEVLFLLVGWDYSTEKQFLNQSFFALQVQGLFMLEIDEFKLALWNNMSKIAKRWDCVELFELYFVSKTIFRAVDSYGRQHD